MLLFGYEASAEALMAPVVAFTTVTATPILSSPHINPFACKLKYVVTAAYFK